VLPSPSEQPVVPNAEPEASLDRLEGRTLLSVAVMGSSVSEHAHLVERPANIPLKYTLTS
jgi:hypothetical protein